MTTTTPHAMYKASSPYYRQILNHWGRWLSGSQVSAILDEHGPEMRAHYIAEHGVPSASADTDAAELLGWLGY